MNGLLNNRKGTTLVEILVVMVILLVGIMIVVQMFPTGFKVVRAAESQTIATKLAQGEIERWKNMPQNLPDGILPLKVGYDADLNPSDDVLNDQDPGPPFEGFTGPTGGPFNPGNAVNCRYVRNETTSIPIGSFFTTGFGPAYGSRYTLAFSPIEVSVDPNNADLYKGLSIKSGDLARRNGDADSYIRLTAAQYGIDPTVDSGHFHVAFPAAAKSHTYYLSYSYWVADSAGDTTMMSRVDQSVDSDPNGGWVEVPVTVDPGYTLSEIESGTDSCARAFVQVKPKGWSSDPYEFTLVDQVLGVIAFNPIAKNTSEYTARGWRPITARIDYRIYDPRIIREDKVVGTPNEQRDYGGSVQPSTSIKLALRFILNAGLPDNISDGDPTDNPDEPTFEGLVRTRLGMLVTSATDLTVEQSMLIIDLETGLRVDMTNVKIDFESGVVHLPNYADLIDWQSKPVTANVSLVGKHLRFFYRADGDWSVQCQKAYTYYLRKYDKSRTDYCHFKVWNDLNTDGTTKASYLLFARCDAGKTVSVDYTYRDNSGDRPHRVVARAYKISDDWVDDPDTPATADKIHCPYVKLALPADTYLDTSPRSRLMVVGTSFRARVVWRDGKQWRFRDIDTTLTRNSSP